MRYRVFIFFATFLGVLSICEIIFSQDAESLKAQGDEAYKAKEYDKAIEFYKASLKINGRNWQVHEALGNAYFKAKRYTEAAASYAEALGYNPQLISAYYNIGYSYMKAGLFNEAIKYLEKYTNLKADDPDGFYRLAESYYSVGEKENAIKNYEKFLSMVNKDVSQKKIDDAKLKLSELKGQTTNFATVPTPISVSPISGQQATGSVVSQVTPSISTLPSQNLESSKGISQQQSTNPDPSTQAQGNPTSINVDAMMKTSLANDPAIEIIREADGHLANGNYRLAISTYRDALIKNPNSIQARYNLGIALAKVERYEQAIAEWEKVLQLDPSNVGAQENINRARAKMAGLTTTSAQARPPSPQQQSQPVQNQQSQLSPIEDLLAKANKANSSGDYVAAIKYIDELLTMRKDVAEAYVVKGDALLGMAKYLEAINEYKKALALNPQLANPLFGMAESYRLLAKTDMAIQYYKLFLNSPAQDKAKWRIERATKMLKALESIR
ncbi:MAG: tetratricopeptide repeat protein [Deltaproteobacteria bacterium]|nr:tetratricopeptide repeat protein [Deltaproteobacteria bacterium]